MAEQVLKVLGSKVNNQYRIKMVPNEGGDIEDVMIGAVMSFASKNIKTGWLPCNGQEISRSQYPKLFEMIGTTYGTPSNNGVFKLPNLNRNQYFIRGGEEIGKEQLATPQVMDGYDHGSVHGIALWHTDAMQKRFGQMVPATEIVSKEKFGDDIYSLPNDKFIDYKDFLTHIWSDVVGRHGGTDAIDRNSVSLLAGHLIMGSRPKNMTMYYCIYAGTHPVSKPSIETSYNVPAETPRLSLNASNPIGSVTMYAGNTLAPEGWMFCHGQVLSRTKYAKLFAVLGTTYGSTAADNFKLPDYRNQFLRGTSEQRAINTRESDAIRASYGGTFWGSWNSEGGTGAFKMGNKGPNRRDPYGDQGGFDAKYTFDFSNGGPVADEVRPVNVSIHYIIYTGIIG